MIIKEGSKITIVDNNMPYSPIIDEIITQDDIDIENETGEGYIFLLRHEDSKESSIFEAEKINKTENGYVVEGYFKDAILVLKNKESKLMYNSYMDYNS